FFERDATGWQFINMANGNADMNFTLYSNTNRIVRYDDKQKHPEDTVYQDEKARILPQTQY
ncbi:MAG TPA: serine/threonine protein phosphatase, partial [Methylobacter sp.]